VVNRLVVNSLIHDLTAADVTAFLEKQKRLSKAILSDHGSQFKEQWKEWCSEPALMLILRFLLTHGTSVRSSGASRTSMGSSSVTFRRFSEWLRGKLGECK